MIRKFKKYDKVRAISKHYGGFIDDIELSVAYKRSINEENNPLIIVGYSDEHQAYEVADTNGRKAFGSDYADYFSESDLVLLEVPNE